MKNGMLGLISSTTWKLFSQPITRGFYADHSNGEWMFSSVKFAETWWSVSVLFRSCLGCFRDVSWLSSAIWFLQEYEQKGSCLL